MELSPFNLTELCDVALDAAKQAGELIATYAEQEIVVHKKEVGTSLASQVVTEVDQKSQDLILELLTPTLTEYDLGLLTEESEDDGSRFEKDYFWCIDPLDGTLPFTEKRKGYAVSIALVAKNGESVIGVIYEPLTKLCCWAIKEGGVFKTEKKILEVQQNNTLTLICDRAFNQHSNYKNTVASLKETALSLGYTGLNLMEGGGSVMNAIWVLQYQPACYFKFPKKEKGGGNLWDYAATVCIFNEMGMPVSDVHGNALNLNAKASTFFNEIGVLFASEEQLVKPILSLNAGI